MISIKQKLGFNLFDVFTVTFCGAFALICFYPMWYVFIASITPFEDFIKAKFLLLPPLNPTFEYYKMIISSKLFRNAMVISFAKTLIGAVGTLLLTGMLSYGVSKKNIKGMKTLNFLIVFTMFFGGGLVPTYILYNGLHLLKTFWVMVIPAFTSISTYVIMRNYFSFSIPSELEDACVIDGANELIMFFKIVVPLSKPMLAAMFLFEAVGHWNDYYSFLMFVDDNRLQPFVWLLRRLLIDPTISQTGQDSISRGLQKDIVGFIPPVSLRMTTIICAMLPIMLVYPFLQKYFAKGILIGALKE